jgi:hypothetical protein
MKLAQWAQISEVLATVGIVVTLLFVAFEIRTNNDLIEYQLEINRVTRDVADAESPLWPDILSKIDDVDPIPNPGVQIYVDRYDMTLAEADYLARTKRRRWVGWQADFAFGYTDAIERLIPITLTRQDDVLYWDTVKNLYDQDFVRFVEDLRQARTGNGD